MDRTFETLTFHEVVEINQRLVRRYGDCDTVESLLSKPDFLENALEEVQGFFLFGVDPYALLVEKAGLLFHRITAGRVFTRGNKMTGFAACQLFLQLNGHVLDFDTDEVVKVARAVAARQMPFEAIVAWLERVPELEV